MSSRNTMLVVGALAVLIILSAANLYVLLSSDRTVSGDNHSSDLINGPLIDPIFVKIGPLTVNLHSDRYGERLLYTTLSLRVENDATREIIKMYMPEVQSRLLVLLSAYTAEQLTTPAGKQDVSRAIMEALQAPLAESQPRLAISAVLFTDFIVQ